MISQVRIKDHWSEQRIFLRRAIAAGVVMLACVIALVVKLVQLQVVRHDYYAELSQGNRVRIEPMPPNRGLILDRHGAVLAENLPAYQLELTSEQTPDVDAVLAELAALQLVEPDDIDRLKRLIRSRRSFEGVPIRLQLTDEEVARFAVRRHEFPGVDIRTRMTRHYPLGELGVHALGYVGAISEQDLSRIDEGEYAGTSLIGKVGVESSYESALHGTTGFRQVLVNAQGRPVEGEAALRADLATRPAVSGTDLILSLDVRAQRAAEAALAGLRGAVVAIDPSNGDVLAFASTPGFDPNRFARGLGTAEYRALIDNIDRPMFNRALRGTYPPGSTIKPVVALAALDYHAIDPGQGRFCRGFFTLPGSRHRYRDWRPEGHGWVNMQEAIAQSCDTYFYNVAQQLGIDRLSTYLRQVRLRSAHRHRHRWREDRPVAIARVEAEELLTPRRADLVSRRYRDHRHRPGLFADDTVTARTHGLDHRGARADLRTSDGHRAARLGHRRDAPHRAAPVAARAGGRRGAVATNRQWHGRSHHAAPRNRARQRGRCEVLDRGQDRHGAGVFDRADRKIQ